MRSPRGVGEADRQRGAERAEVAGHVRVGAGCVVQHQRRDALAEHDDRHPREGRPHPVAPTQPSGPCSGHHALDEVGHGFGRPDTDVPLDGCEPLRERSTFDAREEMPFGGGGLLGEGFAVELGRQHIVDSVTFHAPKVGASGDLVPVLRHSTPMDHLTKLLIAARDGDRRALERFIAETQADVWRVCRYLGDLDDADDLAQETYERAIAAIHRYRADGSARGWLLTIARRTCVDHTRRAVRRRRLNRQAIHEAGAGSTDGGLLAADQSGRVDLESLLDRLGDDRRAAFVLTQVLGLHYDEAAEVLGCPVGTVRSRVSRARGDLVAMIGVATVGVASMDGVGSMDAVASADGDGSGTSRRRRAT